jgi:hypothetical protein
MDDPLELTVLLPCLDEAETLGACIVAAQEFLTRTGVAGEVLVADNGSRDGSAQVARAAGARVAEVAERGYGSALNAGIGAATGRFTIMADSDGSYDLGALDGMLERLRAGDDLVVGDRFAGGIAPGAMPWLHRYVGNPALSWLGRRVSRTHVRDLHCGLRGFRTEAVRALELRTTGMEWASEQIVAAAAARLRIGTVPVTLAPDGRSRPPHLRTWSDGWRHLRFLLLVSPEGLFRTPGLVATTVGLLGTVVLSITPVTVGPVGFDIATLLYAAVLLMLGTTLLWFGAFARTFADRAGLQRTRSEIRSPRLPRFTLERGLAAGTLLSLTGAGFALASLLRWRAAGFAEVDPTLTVRIVVPAAIGLMLGVQTIFSSLLLSALSLPTRAVRADSAGSAATS